MGKTGAEQFAMLILEMPENPIMTSLEFFYMSEMPSSDEEWTKDPHEHGNTEIDSLIQPFGHNKRTQRFKFIARQEFLSEIDLGGTSGMGSIQRNTLQGKEEELVKRADLLISVGRLACIKYLSFVYL